MGWVSVPSNLEVFANTKPSYLGGTPCIWTHRQSGSWLLRGWGRTGDKQQHVNCFNWGCACQWFWHVSSLLFCLTSLKPLQSWVTGEGKDLIAMRNWGKIQDLFQSRTWLSMGISVASVAGTTLRFLNDISLHMFLFLHKQHPRGSCQGLSSPQAYWKVIFFSPFSLILERLMAGARRTQRNTFCPWNQPWSKKPLQFPMPSLETYEPPEQVAIKFLFWSAEGGTVSLLAQSKGIDVFFLFSGLALSVKRFEFCVEIFSFQPGFSGILHF